VTAPLQPKFLEALEAVRDAFSQIDVPWSVIGGLAVIAHGVPRYTADIDVTLLAGEIEEGKLLEVLTEHRIEARIEDAVAFARENNVLLLEHSPSGVPLDLSLAWLPFEEEAIRESRLVDFAGVEVPIPRPEDLLLYKLIAFRPGDLEDAERLFLLHRADINRARIRTLLEEVCSALEDSQRLEVFDRWSRSIPVG
jgi:hypothetical protein